MERLNQIINNKTNRVLIFCIALIFNVSGASAQKHFKFHHASKSYIGFGASFGVKSHKIKSDLAAINNLTAFQEGGSLIVTAGNNFVSAKIETGFYYSASSFKHTIDAVELAGVVNVYPLQLISKQSTRLAPYAALGFSKNNQKFYGYYNTPDNGSNTSPINYSAVQAPYLGKAEISKGTVGIGVEYRIKYNLTFVNLFMEARKGMDISMEQTSLFKSTSFDNSTAFNIGVVFGRQF